ncbi:MAG TPA: hypothetical protein VE998_07085 [Terriglobales bacterium]|nr:hypothetical protein [Terriglobales bacterium]
MLIVASACGGGSSSTATITVSVTPATATVVPGKTQQFTANVQNTSNTAVTWAVNGVSGGNSTTGTISGSGLYTAPDTIPTTPNVTVTATSAANTTITASASVLIEAAVTVTPATATIAAGQTLQFSATVNTTSSNKNVTWQVNGVGGGNSTTGTISSSGLYTAPSTFPVTTGNITVTAVSLADPTQKASATVTISAPPLVISPTAVTLAGGAQQPFTATALGQTVSPQWSVSCPSTAPGACGSITSGGVFTAPVSPPAGGVVTITASMADGSAAPTSTTATIQVSNATLSGAYVFELSNPNPLNGQAEGGVITFDGGGKVIAGTFDVAGNASGPVSITGGTYQLGTDGRGSATIQASSALQWQLVMASHNQGFISALDSSGNTLTGTLDLQQLPSSTTLQGNYAMLLRGEIAGSPAQAFAEAGSLAANSGGSITSATLDFNNHLVASTNASASGSYTAASASGRGTLALNSTTANQSFAYYVVDANRLKLIEVDSARPAWGELYTQPAGPFSAAAFKGRYALTMAGISSAGGPFAMGGVFSLDGSVSIFNRVLDGVNQTVADQQGAYSVTDVNTGRTTLTWNVNHGVALQYAAYPRSDGGFFILETDASAVAAGVVLPQTITSPSLTTLAGGFAVVLSGFEPISLSNPEGLTGQFTYTVGKSLGGTLDVSANGAFSAGLALHATVNTVDPNTGRGTASVQSGSAALANGFLVFYVVDSNRVLVLDSDGSRIVSGAMLRQF